MTPTLESMIGQMTPAEVREAALALSEAEASALLYDWRLWARPEQTMPLTRSEIDKLTCQGIRVDPSAVQGQDWRVWVVKSGRGWGKTRAGVEAVREVVNGDPHARIALVGPTAADCRDVMLEGESGLLAVFPPGERPVYWPSKRRVEFANGAMATLYSAAEPERLRGPQHSFAYVDELAVYPDVEELWQNLKLGLRLGADPRIIVTTTPKPSKFLRALLADPGTVVTSGSTFANRANLPASVLADFTRIYGGTRIGRQELEGELLEEAEGALWSRAADRRAARARASGAGAHRGRDRSVSIDRTENRTNAASWRRASASTATATCSAIIRRACRPISGSRARSRRMMRSKRTAIIGEANQGGDLISSLLKTQRASPQIAYEKVHASRGKIARAEPVAALYEQGKVHHVNGFPQMEDEMVNYVAGSSKSPNRMDALVWALSYLMLKPVRTGRVLSL